MPTNIVIPEMGESVRTGVIAKWHKQPGEYVNRDEPVGELETDKITADLTAPAAGRFTPLANVGDTVNVGAVVARIDEAEAPAPGAVPAASSGPAGGAAAAVANGHAAPAAVSGAPVPGPSLAAAGAAGAAQPHAPAQPADIRITPLARKLAEQHGVDVTRVRGTGAGGRIREQDILALVDGGAPSATPAPAPIPAAQRQPTAPTTAGLIGAPVPGSRATRRERMSPLRQRIAARLVEAQHTAAMLTTFNEADMSAVMDLRKRHKESFEKRHGIGLGFMSFFVKAVCNALRQFPAVNASIVSGGAAAGGSEIEYHDYCDIAVAVGTPRGLVVPVLRNCESLSFAQIEQGIKDLAARAKDGRLTLDELQGGTFTITNGGIYGSLMSTPILNPPQAGILGMHAIKNRPVEDPAHPGQIVLRPMMYLALSYDHRLIDGAEAVQFLVAVKQAIEEPERLLLAL
jgi:2-oxoglutarate dehydrogenase E2 component (dihydrolipoamide succinyltransferase)